MGAPWRVFSSLKSRAWLIILLAVMPLLLFTLDTYRRERSEAILAIDDDLRRTLRAVLVKENEVANTIRLTLSIMSHANDMKPPTVESCSGLARRLIQSHPDFANIGSAWPDGEMFCSARPTAAAVNVADRAWFREVTARGAFSKGYYIKGRVSGKDTVVYGYPQKEARALRSALFASVPLDWFRQAIDGVRIPEGWQAAVVTAEGVLAAEVATVGEPHQHAEAEILKLLGVLPIEPEVRQVVLEGRSHLVGLAPLPSTHDLYVMISSNADAMLEPVNRRFKQALAITFMVTAVSMVVAWWLIQGSVLGWVSAMGRVLARFGAGELSARAGAVSRVRELQALSDNFDAMALRIEQTNDALEGRVAVRTAALERTNTELEAFAYSISHDLRAPLRAVGGFADILKSEHAARLDAEGQRYLDHICTASERMNAMIDDLLQYSRVGRAVVRDEPAPLAPLIEGALTLYKPQLPKGALTIEMPLATPRGDARLIEKVLANLIDNALKYQPPGQTPQIRLRTRVSGGTVELQVIDNGIGIAPEHHDKIFTVFQRLHGDSEYPGTGIGLAIAMKAAQLMNGTLTIRSSPGHGSTFSLLLPAAFDGNDE